MPAATRLRVPPPLLCNPHHDLIAQCNDCTLQSLHLAITSLRSTRQLPNKSKSWHTPPAGPGRGEQRSTPPRTPCSSPTFPSSPPPARARRILFSYPGVNQEKPPTRTDSTMQSLHSAITPPAPPAPRQLANFPTSRKVGKSKSWQVGKHHPPLPPHLFTPLLPYPRVDHHPAAGECHRLARPRRPTPCSTAPSLCSPSYPGVRENPASAPTPCNRPATLLPPWCSPNLVSRLNPPHPLIHHPASARRSFLLPCPAGKPPPPSSGGTLASTRNAAKPPATSSVSWPATTQRHTNHTTAALALPPG